VVSFTDRPQDLTVGVIGGMGPRATADFFHLLVGMTPADKDWNHLHIIVDNNPRIPSRTRAFLFDEESPAPYLIAGAERLVAAGAQLLVVPCNSASFYLAPVRAAVATPILDPVMATVHYANGARAPLVLGGMVTHRAKLYAQALGVDTVRPTDAEQDEVAALIEALKHGETTDDIVARTRRVIDAGIARGAGSVILGCTEFGLIADRLALGVPIYNSNALLAQRTLELARPA
jgi:aspartate racemase